MVLSLIYNHLNVILQARLLQDETTNNADNKEETTSDTNTNSLTQTQIIRDTCIIYGSIFAFLFILFLILRPYYPTVYNIKKCYPKLQLLHRDAADADESKSDDNKHGEREETGNNNKHQQMAAVDENEYHTVDNDGSMHSTNYATLSTLPDAASPALSQSTTSQTSNNNIANNTYGPISWMYKILDINDTDICEECGVDALTTIRLLDLGVKLSFVGVINSAFLVPTYALMGTVLSTSGISDPVLGISLSNLEQGSNATIATTIAAYIFFISACYFIQQDLDWFTKHRHNFLSKKYLVKNYSLFISGIPKEIQSNKVLGEYFGNCFAPLPFYGGGAASCDSSGNTGTNNNNSVVASVHVASQIPNLQKKVVKRNKLVPKLEHAINVQQYKDTVPMHKTKLIGGEKIESVPAYSAELETLNDEISTDIDKIMARQQGRGEGGGHEPKAAETDVEAAVSDIQALPNDQELDQQEDTERRGSETARRLSSMSETVKYGASVVKSVIMKEKEDGDPRSAAFISFTNLTSTNLARQAVHYHEAWAMVPHEPPLPELVNWKNVGKSNMSKQIGELLSLILTVTLCIFWTIPVSFVSSLSNVESLTETFKFLKEPVENSPIFGELLAILAPLILVAFVSLLPHILLAFTKLEGLVEIESMQSSSLFSKVAAFTIIQTFFVSAVSGTIFASIEVILNDPIEGLKKVAAVLPAQSAYFVQIIIVQNGLSLGLELLRVSAVAQNYLRGIAISLLGHNLTDKERNSTFMGLRSLDDPLEYYFGKEMGQKTILIMMVLFVYGSGMAPLTSYFTLFIFGFLTIGFRHQFFYVYPIANDSGGDLWIRFIRLSIICMILAELFLMLILFIKEAFIAGVMLVPLLIATILFDVYFKRRHYAITACLPLGDCAIADRKNDGPSREWLMNAYLQPELKDRVKYPDNYNSVRGEGEGDGSADEEEDATDIADSYKEKGNTHMANNEYELALHNYTQAIETEPNGPNSHIYYANRAAAYIRVGELSSAADDCHMAILLDDGYVVAYTRLGLALFFQGSYDAAVGAYEKSLDLDPENETAFNYLIKAKERIAKARQDENEFEIQAPWPGTPLKTDSFDPSISVNH